MSRPRALSAAAALGFALTFIGPSAAPACGCGVMLRGTVAGEKALITFHDGMETIVPGLSVTRVGPQAAVVFPVPRRPRIRALPNVDIFGELETALTPQQTEPGSGSGKSAAVAQRPTVISQQQLGGYRVTVLKGGSGETLNTWLRSHNYTLPSGSQPILAQYISRDWYFVAIRLADVRAGQIKPLAIAFPSAVLAYPMLLSRVATDPVSVELFVNADSEVSAGGVDGFVTSVAAPVSNLAFSPTLRALLPARYLTRLDSTSVAPSAISSDVTFTAVSGHAWLYVLVPLLAVAVLGAGAFVVVRRRRAATG